MVLRNWPEKFDRLMMSHVAERAQFNRRNIKGKMFDRIIKRCNTILTDGISRAEFDVGDQDVGRYECIDCSVGGNVKHGNFW